MCFQGEIDAREDSFRATAEAGQKLLESKHYAVEEVKEKVENNWKLFSLYFILFLFFLSVCQTRSLG